MALITKREFALSMGMDYDLQSVRSHISMSIKRNKIIEKDGCIDSEDQTNKTFFLKHKKEIELSDSKESISISKSSVKKEIKEQKPKKEIIEKKPKRETTELYELELNLKKAKLEKDLADRRIMDMREQKLRGEVVPVDLVAQLFLVQGQSVLKIQKSILERIMAHIARVFKVSEEQLAEMRMNADKELNDGVLAALESTKRELQPIIKGYSDKKLVGQKW